MMDAQAGETLRPRIIELRGDPASPPDASIVIPVNAQGDLGNVLNVLRDIVDYSGPYTLEVLLVVNNYPPDEEPPEVDQFREMGLTVVAIPSVRRPGEAVGFTARIHGVRAASTEYVLLFDADCRIPNSRALFDWYVQQLHSGVDVAYTHVGYYDLRDHPSIRARMFAHHGARWFKRAILRIPTTRGSNYAVKRTKTLNFYDQGLLADEMNVGPTIKKFGGRVVYSGAKELTVMTSGRMFTGGWHKLSRYLMYRLRYNLRVLPVGRDAARRTGRESDPVRRYVDNVSVRDEDIQS